MEQKTEKDPTGELQGVLQHFTYRNLETGFAVARFRVESGRPVTLVGALAQLVEGQQLKVRGGFQEHARFGPQFVVEEAIAVLPSSIDGIRAYLTSSMIKGVGPATADRILAAFGAESLKVIEEQPDRLHEVQGLGRKRITELVAAVRSQRDVQEVMVFLRAHGLGQNLAMRIVKHYGRGAAALIQANPFRLADDVFGIGFKTADRLASEMGVAGNAPERIQAGILFCLTQAAREGHCYLPDTELAEVAARLLDLDPDMIPPQIAPLSDGQRIVVESPVPSEPTRIYPIMLHQAETGIASAIERLVAFESHPLPIQTTNAIEWYRQQSGLDLPEGQRLAVQRALENPVSVITGGPGVGKTTIIRALAQILAAKKLSLLLAAPTGRAAKRLEESTGHAASTVHRLLDYQPGVDRFSRDLRNPLSGHMLVVDEASMLDARLAYHLVRAVPAGMHLVFVGDVNQLPAVGAGQVLDDLIESTAAPVTRLTTIFRQQGGSLIVLRAHGLLSGEMPLSADVPGSQDDFYFIETRDNAGIAPLIEELITKRIPERFGLDPVRDIQVLCPMYRGQAGADALNQHLQDALNPNRAEVTRGGQRFRVGDKVMQTRNDYDLDLFNGDAGRIVGLPAGETTNVRVAFGDRMIDYPLAELDALIPAYAITVHRSQGSEYPAVIMPLATDHFMMLRRNLLYTAITRGRRLVVLVGSRRALSMATDNHEAAGRYSGLARRLRERIERRAGSR